MARTRKNFARMNSKELQTLLNEGNLTSEERITVTELLADRASRITCVNLLKPQKTIGETIQDYKNEFAALYSRMITETGVDKASVSIAWTTEEKNGERVNKPNVLIVF